MATKRKNPFIEEVPRQMKVYVGPKQVAGVEEMKRVHGIKFIISHNAIVYNDNATPISLFYRPHKVSIV